MASISDINKRLQVFQTEGAKFVSNHKKDHSQEWSNLLKIERETEKELTDYDVSLPDDVHIVIQKTLRALMGMIGKKETEQMGAVIVALRAIRDLQKKLKKVPVKGKSKLQKPVVHKSEPGASNK